MKNISLLTLLLLLFIGVQAKAQEIGEQRKISLKLYSQIMAEKQGNRQGISLKFNPAVSLATKNGHFHELELIRFRYNRQQENLFPGATITNFNSQLGLRYSFNYCINKEGKLKAFIGVGLNSYRINDKKVYQNKNLKDETAYSAIINNTKGVSLNITPRLIWNISDKWFLDINIPVNTFEYDKATYTGGYDGGMQTNEVKSTTFPNQYTVNVGLGFKF